MGNANTALVEFTGGVSFGISPTKIAADEIFKRIDYSLNRQNALVSCITSSAVVCPNRTTAAAAVAATTTITTTTTTTTTITFGFCLTVYFFRIIL